MYNKQYYWSLNGQVYSSDYVRFIYNYGSADFSIANATGGIAPVVTLKASVLFTGGTGTVTDPYIIKP